jgi:zinc protease
MRTIVLALAGLLIATRALLAAGAAPAAFPRPEIKNWSLGNGMEVIYLGVHRAPVVTVQVWVHAGSKDEPRDRRGSAHMFEHIMFKGTRNVPPEEHSRLIDKIGGRNNAFTTEDLTAYHDTVPRAYLDFAMQLEAERLQNLLFRPAMIATEKEVVKEEIRQRENNPIAKAFVRFREMAFVRHPYAWDAGGRITDLENTAPADLERFYRAYYQPNNALLIVAGDVTEEQVRQSAERWFAKIPKAGDPPRPAREAVEPPQDRLKQESTEPAQMGVIIGGYKIPAARSEDMPALNVLGNILSGGESSRLYQRVVRKDKLGVYAGLYLHELEDPGLMLVFGAYLNAEQGPKVAAAIQDEATRLRDAPVGARELDKAKNQLLAGFVFGLQDVSGLAVQVGHSAILRGDPRAWLDDYPRIQAVTVQDVQRVAKKYLVPERLTLVTVPPGGGAGGGAGGGQ